MSRSTYQKIILDYFKSDSSLLLFGITAGQMMPVAISPLLTRLYSLESFGLFALFMSISTISSSFLAWKFELSIFLSKSRSDNVVITNFCLLISLISGLLLEFLVWVVAKDNSSYLFLSLCFFQAFVLTVFQILYNYHNKSQNYKYLSISIIIQAVFFTIISLMLGLYSSTFLTINGLITSALISQVIANLILFGLKKDPLVFWAGSKRYKQIIIEHKSFPKYSMITDLIQRLAIQLPVLTIGTLFGAAQLGAFSLAQRIGLTPISLISKSFGSVFFQKASDEFRIQKNFKTVFFSTLQALFLIAIIVFIVFAFLVSPMIGYVFGSDWGDSGKYLFILSFLLFFQIIANPLSNSFFISQNQKILYVIQLIFLMVLVSTYFGIWLLFKNPYLCIWVYVFVYSLKYILEFSLSKKYCFGESGSMDLHTKDKPCSLK